MAYKEFTLLDLQQKFKIQNKVTHLFKSDEIKPISPSEILVRQLEEAAELPIKSEKARSELIITPILLELRRRNNKFFTIYSGDYLVADKTKNLTGECDFILAKETGSFSINVPIIMVVEAKRQDMEMGINQCAAQLYGAQVFNKQSNTEQKRIYGCVTTADDWKFMMMEGQMVQIDHSTYYKSEMPKILGIFQEIVDYYRT